MYARPCLFANQSPLLEPSANRIVSSAPSAPGYILPCRKFLRGFARKHAIFLHALLFDHAMNHTEMYASKSNRPRQGYLSTDHCRYNIDSGRPRETPLNNWYLVSSLNPHTLVNLQVIWSVAASCDCCTLILRF